MNFPKCQTNPVRLLFQTISMASIFVEKLLVKSGVECSLWIAFNMIYAFAACLPQVGTIQIKIHNTRVT